jgi:curli biogenesis system outer membrane secretion channel CsgG
MSGNLARDVGAVKRSSMVFGPVALAVAAMVLSACVSTAPTMGENKGTVSGAAGGATTEGNNSALEKCGETLGTLALQEDTNAPWYVQLRGHQLGSTIPVLRLMIQQSNCFVIVERGGAMNNMMRERALEQSGEARGGSNFGKGQMVAADYTMSPSIQFSAKTGGGAAGLATRAFGGLGALAGGVSTNEASTTLLLIDNRSGVQISAAEGTAKNMDFSLFGGAFGGLTGGSAGGYSSTPQGKVIVTAFADSYNQMIKALRNYKAQTVKGGLGTGGRLGVDGGTTAAPKEATPAAAAAAPAAAPAAKPAPKKAPAKPAAAASAPKS